MRIFLILLMLASSRSVVAETKICDDFLTNSHTIQALVDDLARARSLVAMVFELSYPTSKDQALTEVLKTYDVETLNRGGRGSRATLTAYAVFTKGQFPLFNRLLEVLGPEGEITVRQSLTETEKQRLASPTSKATLRAWIDLVGVLTGGHDLSRAGVVNYWHVIADRFGVSALDVEDWPSLPEYGADEEKNLSYALRRSIAVPHELIGRFGLGAKALAASVLGGDPNATLSVRRAEDLAAALRARAPEIAARYPDQVVAEEFPERTAEGLLSILHFIARAANQPGEEDLARKGFLAAFKTYVPADRLAAGLAALDRIALNFSDAVNARKRVLRQGLPLSHRRIIQAWRLLVRMALAPAPVPSGLDEQIASIYRRHGRTPEPFHVFWGFKKVTNANAVPGRDEFYQVGDDYPLTILAQKTLRDAKFSREDVRNLVDTLSERPGLRKTMVLENGHVAVLLYARKQRRVIAAEMKGDRVAAIRFDAPGSEDLYFALDAERFLTEGRQFRIGDSFIDVPARLVRKLLIMYNLNSAALIDIFREARIVVSAQGEFVITSPLDPRTFRGHLHQVGRHLALLTLEGDHLAD